MKKFLRISLLFLLVALLIGVAFADNTDEQSFVLVNKSGSTFRKIYLAPTGKSYWHLTQDAIKIKNGTLKDGESMDITLPQQSSATYLSKRTRRFWDFGVELPNGKRHNWLKLNFADVYKIEITRNKNGSMHLTYFTNK